MQLIVKAYLFIIVSKLLAQTLWEKLIISTYISQIDIVRWTASNGTYAMHIVICDIDIDIAKRSTAKAKTLYKKYRIANNAKTLIEFAILAKQTSTAKGGLVQKMAFHDIEERDIAPPITAIAPKPIGMLFHYVTLHYIGAIKFWQYAFNHLIINQKIATIEH